VHDLIKKEGFAGPARARDRYGLARRDRVSGRDVEVPFCDVRKAGFMEFPDEELESIFLSSMAGLLNYVLIQKSTDII
jgi:hypothetical protein